MKTINRMRPSNGLQHFIDDFFNQSISEVLGTAFKTSHPSVNISEDDKTFYFEFAAPGLSKEDFNLEIDKGILTVSTNSKNFEELEENQELEDTTNSVKFKRQEFNFSGFKRSFHIPESANESEIKAHYKLGILKITIKKFEEELNPTKHKIEIS